MNAYVFYYQKISETETTIQVERKEREYDSDTVGKFSYYHYYETVPAVETKYWIYGDIKQYFEDDIKNFYQSHKTQLIEVFKRMVATASNWSFFPNSFCRDALIILEEYKSHVELTHSAANIEIISICEQKYMGDNLSQE